MQYAETKKALRLEVKQKYKSLSDRDKEKLSQAASLQLRSRLSDLPKGTKIGIFLSMWDELNTLPLIESLKAEGWLTILVPRVEGEEMQFYAYEPNSTSISTYGIIEPTQPTEEADVPEVMIVPGIAFDTNGGRVGRGKGFYDKYFARYRNLITLKIAFVADFQVHETVPMESHDMPVDEIITDLRHLHTRPPLRLVIEDPS